MHLVLLVLIVLCGVWVLFLWWQVSSYPVILSLENHCSREQQEILAHYLTSILGDKLLRTPVDLTAAGILPSPNVG